MVQSTFVPSVLFSRPNPIWRRPSGVVRVKFTLRAIGSEAAGVTAGGVTAGGVTAGGFAPEDGVEPAWGVVEETGVEPDPGLVPDVTFICGSLAQPARHLQRCRRARFYISRSDRCQHAPRALPRIVGSQSAGQPHKNPVNRAWRSRRVRLTVAATGGP